MYNASFFLDTTGMVQVNSSKLPEAMRQAITTMATTVDVPKWWAYLTLLMEKGDITRARNGAVNMVHTAVEELPELQHTDPFTAAWDKKFFAFIYQSFVLTSRSAGFLVANEDARNAVMEETLQAVAANFSLH